MRILFITPWYPDDARPNHGIFIRELAVALVEEGNQVVVISTKVDYGSFNFFSQSVDITVSEGVEEHRLVMQRSIPIVNQGLYLRSSLRYARKIAESFRPDVVHGMIGYPGAVLAVSVARAIGCRSVVTEHTRITNNFRSWPQKFFTVNALKQANRVTTVSRFMADEIQGLIGRPITIVPNFIDPKRYKVKSTEKGKHGVNIGFLGGLDTDVKGLDVLLKALANCDFDYVLHIGGEGKLRLNYEQLASDLGVKGCCRFYGLVRHAEVPEFLASLDFFVCSSRFESFGLVGLEALASGVPVVATRCGGTQDFVSDQTGILVEPDNVNSLTLGLNQMHQRFREFDPNDLRQLVIERFGKSASVAEWQRLYSSVE